MGAVEHLEHHDETDWWFAVQSESYDFQPVALAKSEEAAREQLIVYLMEDDDVTREEAERMADNGSWLIGKCAVRIAWVNDCERAEEQPDESWLDPASLPEGA